MKINLDIEISHVWVYKEYTVKQRFTQWLLYMLRHFADILSGIIGLLSFGLFQTWWGCTISEKILRNQMKFYKENK